MKLIALKVWDKVANEEWDKATKVDNLVHEESKDASNNEWITAFVHGFPKSFDIVELLHAAFRCDCYCGRVHWYKSRKEMRKKKKKSVKRKRGR